MKIYIEKPINLNKNQQANKNQKQMGKIQKSHTHTHTYKLTLLELKAKYNKWQKSIKALENHRSHISFLTTAIQIKCKCNVGSAIITAFKAIIKQTNKHAHTHRHTYVRVHKIGSSG